MFLFERLKKGLQARNIIPLVILIIFGFLCLVFFIYFIYGQYLANQEIVIQDIELESQKMRLNSELMELARSRTRLTSKIIDLEDVFEQDELNQELEIYASRFSELRGQLLALELTDEEKSLLDKQLEIIPIILPNQRKAVELAMSDNPQDDKVAQDLLYEIVLPGQTKMIESLAKLIEIEQEKIALLSKDSKTSLNQMKEKSTVFIIVTLAGIIIISFFVISRIKHIQLNLLNHQKNLEKIVRKRTDDLTLTNRALEDSLNEMKKTQNRLVESEKMVALGQLVAGVAHEVNTPLGISVTAASHLEHETNNLKSDFENEQLTNSKFMDFIEAAEESNKLLSFNLRRAVDLISGFKQVSVDQSSEQPRTFDLSNYLDEIMLSIKPQFKKMRHQIIINCPKDTKIHSIPGTFSQIITNLTMNSLKHGFSDLDNDYEAIIEINVSQKDKELHLNYKDNGKGMTQEQRLKIFDPFYTTARGQGGSGLGMFVVYNLVTQKLKGDIVCQSSPGKGVEFNISFPVS